MHTKRRLALRHGAFEDLCLLAPMLHRRGDTFDLPDGAVRLASTALTPNQAFAVGGHALELQFRVEVGGAAIEPWLIGHTCALGQAGICVNALRTRSREVAVRAAQAGCGALGAWLDGTGAAG